MSSDDQWLKGLNNVLQDLKANSPQRPAITDRKRRGRPRSLAADTVTLNIVERDGVIRFSESAAMRVQRSIGLRRGRSAPAKPDKPMATIDLERLEPSKIYAKLEQLDLKLTPHASNDISPSKTNGLRKYQRGKLVKGAVPVPSGRILLFVHGTFSNSENIFRQLNDAPAGKEFLSRLGENYQQILTFDHRTLGVSPMINARELALLFADSNADVDIICHSRGGLVSRWWAEAFDRSNERRKRIIFVAAPLSGTGLAAPPNIRNTIDLLANISRALGVASAAFPFTTIAAGLFQTVSSISKFAAKSPLADAVVALVPGLDAMSAVKNNHELHMLQRYLPNTARTNYFVVKSNFEPENVGWQFWKVFRDGKQRALDVVADTVFNNENDLVVDAPSMNTFQKGFKLPPDNIYDFGTNGKVHHTNYFEQEETLKFFNDVLSP